MKTPDKSDELRVLVACMPKSGSTFLSEVIANLPGMRRATLLPGHQRREQEICIKALEEEILKTKLLHQLWRKNREIMSRPRGFVAQQHVRYSLPTDVILREYEIVPVVLVRNLFDVVVSLRDHLVKSAPFMSMAYVSEEMRSWPEEKMYHFIADMAIPWYVNFFACWSEHPSAMLVTYERMIDDKVGTLAEILEYCGLQVGLKKLRDVIDATGGDTTRKNQGVAGRGDSLPVAVKDKIMHYASYYPDYDLSPIGLGHTAQRVNGSATGFREQL